MTERVEASDEPGVDSRARSSEGELSRIVAQLIAFQERHMQTQERILYRDLRWRNVRAALIAGALVVGPIVYYLWMTQLLAPEHIAEDYAALVRIEGLIAADRKANADKVNRALEKAFEDEDAKGVVLVINSPGGAPVQASLIHERLNSLKQAHPDKRTIAIGEDMLTSGAYFVAAAADEIYVNRSTMTGSIGVVMNGWGLDRLIRRYDIERRVFTAGKNKNRLDPFSPLTPEDQAKVQALLTEVHEHFIAAVKAGRGGRLKGADEVLFSGDYWSGEQAVAMGLADGLSDLASVLSQRLDVTDAKDYTLAPSVWQSLSNSFGVWVERWIAPDGRGHPMLLP